MNPRTNQKFQSTRFTAHDKGVLEQLPDVLKNTFPYIVTHRAAITKAMMGSLSTMVVSPASFSQWAATVREAHAEHILSKNEALISLYESKKEAGCLILASSRQQPAANIQPPAVQPLCATVSTPGPGYFTNVYLHGVDEVLRRQNYQRLMRLTHSPVWRFDHCHKPAKTIRLASGARASEGTAILVGSHMQVMGFWNVASTKLDELATVLQLVRKRCQELGSVSATVVQPPATSAAVHAGSPG